MAGHAGNKSVTVLNLVIVDVNVEEGYILVKGALPGAKKTFVTIRTATKTLHGKPEVVKDLLVRKAAEPAPAAVEAKPAEPATPAAPAENKEGK